MQERFIAADGLRINHPPAMPARTIPAVSRLPPTS